MQHHEPLVGWSIDTLVTLGTAATLTRRNRMTVYRWAQQQDDYLRTIRVGRVLHTTMDEVQRFMKRRGFDMSWSEPKF